MRHTGLILAASALALLLAGAARAAEFQPFLPDYSTPEATALSYCRAQNLESGRVELVRSCFADNGTTLPASMLERLRAMCRVTQVVALSVPLQEDQDPLHPEPFENGDVSLDMEQWDPAVPEQGILKRWLVLRNLGGDWKIIYWGEANDADNPPDDIPICTGQRWWGLPVLASPVNVVCNFALETTYHPEWLPRFMAPEAVVPEKLRWDDAEVAVVRPEHLVRNVTATETLPEDAEVDLDVFGSLPGGDSGECRYRFSVHRTGDEWRIKRIERLGPLPAGPGAAGEGK